MNVAKWRYLLVPIDKANDERPPDCDVERFNEVPPDLMRRPARSRHLPTFALDLWEERRGHRFGTTSTHTSPVLEIMRIGIPPTSAEKDSTKG